MGRHPVLAGALIGAGVGGVGAIAWRDCVDQDFTCGQMKRLLVAECAGIGALAGWIVSLVRD